MAYRGQWRSAFPYNTDEDYDTNNLAEIIVKSPYSFATNPLGKVLAGGIPRLGYLTIASIGDEDLDGVPCKKSISPTKIGPMDMPISGSRRSGTMW